MNLLVSMLERMAVVDILDIKAGKACMNEKQIFE